MGLLDMIQSMAGGSDNPDHAKVAGGLLEVLKDHPDGLQAVINAFQNNGLGQHATAWGNGQAAPVTPDQVQQGLNGTGFLEAAASKAGVSPQVAQAALAAALPMIMQHLAAAGGQGAAQGSSSILGDLAKSVLGRMA